MFLWFLLLLIWSVEGGGGSNVSCSRLEDACSFDLKYSIFNESYSDELLDLLDFNDDVPTECRQDLCMETISLSEVTGNLTWPMSEIGQRRIVRCMYAYKTPIFAYRDCVLKNNTATWQEVHNEFCPRPPFTVRMQEITSELSQQTQNGDHDSCLKLAKIMDELVEIRRTYPNHPIFWDDRNRMIDLCSMVPLNCQSNKGVIPSRSFLSAVDLLFTEGFSEVWSAGVNTFVRVLIPFFEWVFSLQINKVPNEFSFDGSRLFVNNHEVTQSSYNFSHEYLSKAGGANESTAVTIFIPPSISSKLGSVRSYLISNFGQLSLATHAQLHPPKPPPLPPPLPPTITSSSSDWNNETNYIIPLPYPEIYFTIPLHQDIVGPLLFVEFTPDDGMADGSSWSPISTVAATIDVTFHIEELSQYFDGSVQCGQYQHKEDAFMGSRKYFSDWYLDCETILRSTGIVQCRCHKPGYITIFRPSRHSMIFPPDMQPPDLSQLLGFPFMWELYITGQVLRAVSLLCLAATILSYVIFRKARKGTPTRILLNLCFSLICLLVVLYIADQRSGSKLECRICNVIRYYLALVSLMWNAVEAYNMYRMLIKVFSEESPHFVLKAGFLAWGTPAVAVGVALAVNKRAFDGTYHKCDFRCSLRPETLYYGWLMPMSIIITHNLVVFVLVMRVLCQENPTGMATADLRNLKSRLCGAFTMLVLLGVPWLFSAFGAINAEGNYHLENFQGVVGVIFIVFVSLQGLFIFGFHCARNQLVRNNWRSAFHSIRHSRSDSTYVTSVKSTSSRRWTINSLKRSSNSSVKAAAHPSQAVVLHGYKPATQDNV